VGGQHAGVQHAGVQQLQLIVADAGEADAQGFDQTGQESRSTRHGAATSLIAMASMEPG
jgi:hypothetical protein